MGGISPRCGLGGEVGTLGNFHLNGVNAGCGLAVMPGCPTAFETAIQHHIQAGRGAADLYCGGFNLRIATGPVIGANGKNRKFAFKQIRNV